MKSPGRIKLLLVVAVLGGLWMLARALGVDLSDLTPDRVRGWVLSFGAWAPVVYLLAYAQPIIPLPASIMTGIGGAAFGKGWGTLAALCGATLRAATQFLVARLLGREAVAKLLKGGIASLDQRIGKNSFKAVLLIRLIPNFPFDVQNYGLGFSQARFVPYALATVIGILPGCFAFVYLGYSLTDPKQIWKLGVAIVLVVAAMFLPKLLKRRSAGPALRE